MPFFPYVQMEHPVFQFVSVAPCPQVVPSDRRVWPRPLDAHRLFMSIGKLPSQPALPQAKQTQVLSLPHK